MELKIPGCSYRSRRGDSWPRHRAKARNKTTNRKRVLAELQKIRREDEQLALRAGI